VFLFNLKFCSREESCEEEKEEVFLERIEGESQRE
jgi:hypothetical protein